MKKYTTIGLTVLASVLLAWTPAKAQDLNGVLNTEKSSNNAMQQSQGQIDNLDDQTGDIVQQYRTVIEENAVLRTYNKQVSDQVAKQREDVALINSQIEGITQTRREVMPLIQDMINSLRDFVKADIPFRREERLERIEALQDLMDQPDVPPSERYRLVLDRYKTEADYGQKIDVYEGEAEIDGNTASVIYLSVGRISFVYQTPDSSRSFVWNNNSRAWEELGSEYNTRIRKAIQMAQKAQQADLVRIPVFAPTGAQ